MGGKVYVHSNMCGHDSCHNRQGYNFQRRKRRRTARGYTTITEWWTSTARDAHTSHARRNWFTVWLAACRWCTASDSDGCYSTFHPIIVPLRKADQRKQKKRFKRMPGNDLFRAHSVVEGSMQLRFATPTGETRLRLGR